MNASLKKSLAFLGIAAAATLCATAAWTAQDAVEAGAPSPEMLARMTPGPMHEKLEPLIGKWTLAGKWRMAPDAAWEDFEADVEREWILDGRFVRETMTSEWMGQPFEGIGIIGHDNVRKEFTMFWVDSMSTGTMSSTGKAEGQKLVFEGLNSDPMTGEAQRWSRSVIEFGREKHSYQGFAKSAEGTEFLGMEMTATRR